MDVTDDVDLSEFLSARAYTTGRCTLCALLPKLPDEFRVRLVAALAGSRKTYPSPRIWEILSERGYGIGVETVRKHRDRCAK